MKRFLVIGACFALAFPLALSAAERPSSARRLDPSASQWNAISSLPEVKAISFDERGRPAFLAGRLGSLDGPRFEETAPRFMRSMQKAYGLSGREVFQVVRSEEDVLGQVHVRMHQQHRGLKIVGSDSVLHAWRRSGEVLAVSGRVVSVAGLPTRPKLDSDKAIGFALEQLGVAGTALGEPELTYVVASDGNVHLAWSIMVSYESVHGEELDRIFADAFDGSMAARHPQIHRSKYRKIYDGNNGSSLPGSLMFNEGSSSSDSAAMDAYNNSGYTYDYYWQKFSRDSYDDNGAQLVSTVHHRANYNNAFWNGSQMVYGDGDGSSFSPLSGSLDVVAHELTHAVTDRTADLVYAKESGALNEAWSDVLGASTEAWVDGGITSNTWKLGEDIYTPGTAGDALRYMNNPTADGYSKDYYPERLYPGSCTPNPNTNDNCGVHGNSGIANLAYVLLVQGGTHPRGKTSVNVPGIGITKAEQVFYRALVNYMTSSTNFEGARNATAQAAQDLYGQSEADAVQAAWNAVGVPGGPVTTTELSNGVPIPGLSGSQRAEDFFFLEVPSGASDLLFETAGGSGDADLYVRRGSKPTTSTYDCRPYKGGNAETCPFAAPAAGDWYVMLRGYSTYSGVTLEGSFQTGGSNDPPNANYTFTTNDLTASFTDTSSDPDGTIASRSWTFGDGGTSTSQNPSHTYSADGTFTVTLTVTDNDGATDNVSKSVTVEDSGTAPCTNCTEYTGTLTGSGDTDAHPNGTYYQSGAGNHQAWLEGPAGTDFDLYLFRWTGSWTRVASSTSSNSSEHISYNGVSGYYYWRIESYSGSGSYSVWLKTP